MPMDWEEWQKNRQKNKGPSGIKTGNLGQFFKGAKLPNSGFLFFAPIFLIILWGSTGFFTIQPAEVGLIKRFGAYSRLVEPGLNYHLPYPIESVIKVNINRINRVEIGGNTGSDETMMLTADENIADIKFVVQYRVKDARDYTFSVFNPEKAIKDAATSAMREVIGRNTIDDALTDKRLKIQADTMDVLQTMLDKYAVGTTVVSVELQDVHVPKEVSHAFREVTSAKEDSARSVNEATGYANKVLPEAEGEAFAMVAAANAYKAQRINQAEGEAARFTELLTEYKKAPQITRQRLWLEALTDVLPNAEKFVVSGEVGRSILPHLGLKPSILPKPANDAMGVK